MVFLLALPVQAGTRPFSGTGADAMLYRFATCAGRLSALREHQWLVDGPAAERTARHLAAATALLEAVQTPDEVVEAMSLRIEAKFAQRALLMEADFAPDPRAAKRARARSDDLLAPCLAMLLG